VCDLRRLLLLPLLFAAQVVAAQTPDPMRPPIALPEPSTAAVAPTTLVLNSTLIAKQRRIATINGQRYFVGDRVGDGRLVAIQPTAVVIEQDGRRVRLELLPSPIRKPAGGS